jgi:hypothetical protein
MNRQELKKENEKYWESINQVRREFQEFICYEWNYAVHFSFHKNFDAQTERSNKLIRSYLSDLRRERILIFSAFYIIPTSFVDPEYNPHHIHMLLLVFNQQGRTKIELEDATLRYNEINKCIVHELYSSEAGYKYLTKFKNLRLTDLDSFYFDFYREKLLSKYGSTVGYINDELKRMLV